MISIFKGTSWWIVIPVIGIILIIPFASYPGLFNSHPNYETSKKNPN